MRCSFIYSSAARSWEEPEDYEEPIKELPQLGFCPYCRVELTWEEDGEARSFCETEGCKYDKEISEEENRKQWERENVI